MSRTPGLETERNEALTGWYAANGRDLPWRRGIDPFRVLVSEVMLQQTQASRVADRFEGFMEQYPTPAALAGASLKDVLIAWSGLGYNRRAANLQEAAAQIAAEGWPDTVSGLQALPGVGPYTARAIACFAFGMDEVPVDTNLRRVLSRWHGEPLDGAALQRAAEHDKADSPASLWTQAVMDLAAGLCTPRRPRCSECPVATWCTGPDVYVAPPAQGRFEGSARQLRGAVIRTLIAGSRDTVGLVEATGFRADEVAAALDDLVAEGLITKKGSTYELPD